MIAHHDVIIAITVLHFVVGWCRCFGGRIDRNRLRSSSVFISFQTHEEDPIFLPIIEFPDGAPTITIKGEEHI